MPIAVTFNGTGYTLPAQGDSYAWGTGTTSFLASVAANALSKAGGTFSLTAEVDFGATYGVKAAYLKGQGTVATGGTVRLANATTGVVWRDAANSADLALTVNASNQLVFNGSPLGFGTGTVSSVTVAAGSTKLSSSGSPITTTGTITLDVVEANLTLDSIGGTLSVNKGGSGATTLTGVLKGNGTSAFTASNVALASEVTGTLPVANGGTGAVTLSGYMYGNGTSPVTASSTIPVAALNSGTGASSATFWRGDGTWDTPLNTGVWGSITGTLSTQTDLVTALGLKLDATSGVGFTSLTIQPTSGTGYLNISTTGVSTALTVVAPDAATTAVNTFINQASTNSVAGATGQNVNRSRGTAASPTAVQSGDLLGFYAFGGYDGTAYNGAANMLAFATENFTGSARGASLTFNVRPTGSTTSSQIMRLKMNTTTNAVIELTRATSQVWLTGPLSFTDSTGATTYATINLATTSSASTDLVRKSELASVNPVTTKGDISTFSTVNDRLPVGADDLVLTADSLQTTGLQWRSPSFRRSVSSSSPAGTLPTGYSIFFTTAAGTHATATLTLPASPVDGQEGTLVVPTALTITTLAVASSGGITVDHTSPGTLTGPTSITYVYSSANNTWYFKK